MYHFCTLFDRNYLFKGLALYQSLRKTCPAFVLHILCLDKTTRDVLAKLNLSGARLIEMDEFEDAALKAVKPTRSLVEYYWTCTPSLPLHVLAANPEIELVTYLDADLFFFCDPDPIFEEFGAKSIMLLEHRFPDSLRHLEVYGRYNVQMMCFRRDLRGLACLKWWRERCLEWCCARLEGGRFGDQKYLNDWTERFEGVHVLQHLGAGVAPWNVSQYEVAEREGKLWVNECPLIFFHFHQFQILANSKYLLASDPYSDRGQLPMSIYQRYIDQIEASIAMVHEVAPNFGFGITNERAVRMRQLTRTLAPPSLRNLLKRIMP